MVSNENNMEDVDFSPNKSLERAPSEYPVDRKTCLLFQGYLNHNGYGQKWDNGKDYRAHRLAWEKVHGEIPEGMIVRHKCDVRHCVNINHLELGTPSDNTKDMIKRGRIRCGEDLPQSKLKNGDIPFIRMAKKLVSQSRLSEMFNVRRETIGEIQRGIRWNHI